MEPWLKAMIEKGSLKKSVQVLNLGESLDKSCSFPMLEAEAKAPEDAHEKRILIICQRKTEHGQEAEHAHAHEHGSMTHSGWTRYWRRSASS